MLRHLDGFLSDNNRKFFDHFTKFFGSIAPDASGTALANQSTHSCRLYLSSFYQTRTVQRFAKPRYLNLSGRSDQSKLRECVIGESSDSCSKKSSQGYGCSLSGKIQQRF